MNRYQWVVMNCDVVLSVSVRMARFDSSVHVTCESLWFDRDISDCLSFRDASHSHPVHANL